MLAPILYVSFVQQLRTDSLLPRDREPCLAADVNGRGLSPGFYLGRLSGSWSSLPVYEITGTGALGDTTINNDTTINLIGGDLIIEGDNTLIINAPFEVCGWLTWCFVTITMTQNENNYNITSTNEKVVLKIDPGSTARTITGLIKGKDKQFVIIFNASVTLGRTITLSHQSASSTAANRIFGPNNEDIVLKPGEGEALWYDPESEGWRTLRTSQTPSVSADEEELAATYTATGSFASVGLSVTVPTAGTYLVQAEVTGHLEDPMGSAGDIIEVRLIKNGVDVLPDSERVVCSLEQTNVSAYGSCPCGVIATLAASDVISLQAQCSTTPPTADILSGDTGEPGTTVLRYIRLS